MGEFSPIPNSLNLTRELPDFILSFPVTNQPVSETALKYMLDSLRGTLHADIMQLTKHFTGEIHATGKRVDHIETKMDKFAHSINNLLDADDDNVDEHTWFKAKLVDLEDRSRRNNLKIRGIPESVQPHDLCRYTIELFKVLIPELTDPDMIIDRIHHIPNCLSFLNICLGIC